MNAQDGQTNTPGDGEGRRVRGGGTRDSYAVVVGSLGGGDSKIFDLDSEDVTVMMSFSSTKIGANLRKLHRGFVLVWTGKSNTENV